MKRVAIFVILSQCAALVFAQNPQAVIRELTGTVELKMPGAAGWTPAATGDRIEAATIVSTGFRSAALITIGDSTLTVRPLTRLSLDELLILDNTETVNVALRSGRIAVTVNPPAGSRTSFTVQSPMAVASVRGTSFSMDTVAIQVSEGTVRYEAAASAGGSVLVRVSAGQSTWVVADSGRVINPVIAAGQSRVPPVLPGQTTPVTNMAGGARTELLQGSFDLEVSLASGD